MHDNQDLQYTEYKETTNYFLSAILALIGGLVGVLVWLGPIYFADTIYYITVMSVGIFAAGGAKQFNPKVGNITLAMIALMATVICIVIGEFGETAIIYDSFGISVNDVVDYVTLKYSDDPLQLIFHALSIGFAGWLGFTINPDA